MGTSTFIVILCIINVIIGAALFVLVRRSTRDILTLTSTLVSTLSEELGSQLKLVSKSLESNRQTLEQLADVATNREMKALAKQLEELDKDFKQKLSLGLEKVEQIDRKYQQIRKGDLRSHLSDEQ